MLVSGVLQNDIYIDMYIYIYVSIYILFRFFPIKGWIIVPSRLLIIYFVYSSTYILIPKF